MKRNLLILFTLLCLLGNKNYSETFSLESKAFKTNTLIPDEYTCRGTDKSPALSWQNIPPNSQSLALVVENPDAPEGVWTHWVLFNMSPKIKELHAGAPVPPGAINGKNSWAGLGYRGPCPENPGASRYVFTLYALDKSLDLGEGTTRDKLLQAITGHVIASAELVGLYQKF